MFNMINIGERSGSGVPNIFNIWEDEKWKEPTIEERFDPDRTILTLEFIKKRSIKTGDKKQAIKTGDNISKICDYLAHNTEASTKEIASYIHLSTSRTRVILTAMDCVETTGSNRNRRYRLK